MYYIPVRVYSQGAKEQRCNNQPRKNSFAPAKRTTGNSFFYYLLYDIIMLKKLLLALIVV